MLEKKKGISRVQSVYTALATVGTGNISRGQQPTLTAGDRHLMHRCELSAPDDQHDNRLCRDHICWSQVPVHGDKDGHYVVVYVPWKGTGLRGNGVLYGELSGVLMRLP